MTLRPSDRVLLLFSTENARSLAEQTQDGLVVCLLERDSVYETRQELRDLENVMVAPADPDGILPWQDGFFTVVYAPHAEKPTAEMFRVLTADGVAIGGWGTAQRDSA